MDNVKYIRSRKDKSEAKRLGRCDPKLGNDNFYLKRKKMDH